MKFPDDPIFEFHISRECRIKYGFEEPIYSLHGNVILSDYPAVQWLAERMNAVRQASANPHLAVMAPEINLIALIEEILHLVAAEYRRQKSPRLFESALEELAAGGQDADAVLIPFINTFPPLPVMQRKLIPQEYLASGTEGYPHRAAALEELLFLFLANDNPAYSHYSELFDDARLRRDTGYLQAVSALKDYLLAQPKFGPFQQDPYTLLKAPALASPHSLSGQLEYILRNWMVILPAGVLSRLKPLMLRALDVLKESAKPRGLDPGREPEPDYRTALAAWDKNREPVKYSPDRDWMPNLVMMAKNTYVWLDQLSRKYHTEVRQLDQIPDRELQELAEAGFTGLWLIGLWERSPASRRIKQICGNPEAAASAYSLFEYRIADDLGGDPAYFRLKARAMEYGLRLAVDMVPNHTGLFSRWVLEHPEWFIQLEAPPYPSYSFEGPDLSDDPAVGLFLEDGYYRRSDAAVVFKRVDRRSGRARYIYHGNDGTHMPWNDTAQLNYLLPEVRAAVMDEILRVAGYSSIIRFDAAMTLTKKHYQRLWFPPPGSGGDIPSRSWHGLSQEEFERAFPQEFWRETVDRVAREAPDTLLLAEAFWLMEGYFVRSLGMHRVYNSAFMNMLQREENANYQKVISSLLEFDPRILQRFVNFMNNPDEQPAAAQFGKGDKYFGVCVMMCTLPGLPMFGHGQLEGFAEKYGMEYRRAYWNEAPDRDLMERHRRQIFPLLRQRRLFSQADHFALYQMRSSQGHQQHDVFVYSNRDQAQQTLVVFNNRYQRSEGWINRSFPLKGSSSAEAAEFRLAERLDLPDQGWVAFSDLLSGLEYLRPARQIWDSGLYVQLDGFECHVFTNFRHLPDPSGEYAALAARLQGKGVPSLEHSRWEMRMDGLLSVFNQLLEPVRKPDLLEDNSAGKALPLSLKEVLQDMATQASILFGPPASGIIEPADVAERLACRMNLAGKRPRLLANLLSLCGKQQSSPSELATLYCLTAMEGILEIVPQPQARELLWGRLEEALENGPIGEKAYQTRLLLEVLLDSKQDWGEVLIDPKETAKFLERPQTLQYLGCNWHQDVYWFNREAFLHLMLWLALAAVLTVPAGHGFAPGRVRVKILRSAASLAQLGDRSGFDYHRLMELLRQRKIDAT